MSDSNNMQYEMVIVVLLQRFPKLLPIYERLVDRYKNINEIPGAHVVYGDLFFNYLIGVLRCEGVESKELKNVVRFIEELAASEDQEVKNLVEVSILERLVDEKTDAIIPFLGPHCAKLVQSISERLQLDERTWGRFARSIDKK